MECVLEVSEMVLMMGRQLTKTEILLNLIGFLIDQDPCGILMVYPTLDAAKKFSTKKLAPMIRQTPVLRDKIADPRSRDSGNTILSKQFPGGDIVLAGANSATSLRAVSRRAVLQDEIDDYGVSAGSEGDPCALADGRADNFQDAILVKSSTPTLKGLSRIEKLYEESDQRQFYVPCLRCGHWQTLRWSGVRFDKESPEKAAYVCEACKAELSDFERIRMIIQGQWRPKYPHRRRRGYHLSGLYRMMGLKQKDFCSFLHEFAVGFLDAKARGRETLKAWTNTFLAETWEEEGDRIEAEPLLKRAEVYTPQTLPNEIIIAIASVDVQKTYLQVQVTGLGLDEQTWGIESKTIEGDPEQDDVWQDLAETLIGTYTRLDGLIIPITATAIDMRYKTTRVVKFVQKCGIPRVYPVFGVTGGQTLLVTSRFSQHYRIRRYAVDSKMAKDAVFARLQVEEHGPRYMHFPKGHGYGEGYFQQLTAEVLRTTYHHGHPKQFYDKVRDRNEALDLTVYFLAAVDILKPNLTTIAKKQNPAIPATPPKEYVLKPNTPQQPATAQQRQNERVKIRVGMW